MSEIEKMFENADVIAKECCERDSDLCMSCCPKWNERQTCWKYRKIEPCFTAKKQLELIKFMLGKGVYYDTDKDNDKYWFHLTDDMENASYKILEEALAEFINIIWQDLTAEEKEQIKEILK